MPKLIHLTLSLLLTLAACAPASEPTPAPLAPQTETASYEIYKDGTLLGALVIKPGEFGDFTPTSAPAAESFRELWEREKAGGSISIRMHLPTKDGSRGSYGARIYKPGAGDYPEGVEYFLLDQGYASKKTPSQ